MGLLALFAVLGYKAAGTPEAKGVLDNLASLIKPLANLSAPQLVGFIFLNNAVKAIMVMLLGTGLALFPLLFLIMNGAILGVVIAEASNLYCPWVTFLSLAPHGVLEVPAILLAAGLGMRLGAEVACHLAGRPSQVGQRLRLSLAVYWRICLPAFLMAAIVEVAITPLLAGSKL